MLEKRHPARPGWKAGPVHYRRFESDRHLQAWAEKLEKQQGASSYTRYMYNEIGGCMFQKVKKV